MFAKKNPTALAVGVVRSRKDVWMGIVIWILMIAFLYVFYQAAFVQLNAFGSMLMLGIISFFGTTWFNTRYKIGDDTVEIFYGPLKKSIDIQRIKFIRKTTNHFVAPSLSAYRIEINYGKNEAIQISPKDMNGFVDELLKKNPKIKLNN